jgi:hypothetical protein
MIDKIQKIYDEMKHKYHANILENRSSLKTELLSKLGDQFEIKCDDENNPPNIVDLNCLMVKIMWDKESDGDYKYANLVFGNEEIINQCLVVNCNIGNK